MANKRILFYSFTLLLVALIAVATFFLINKSKNYPSGQRLIYDEYGGGWIETDKSPLVSSVDNDNTNGFRNPSVLRGFFDRYDESKGILYVKDVVPFSGDKLYEVKSMKIGLQQTFYCIQSKITDEKTGEMALTQSYRFPVRDGENLYTYREEPLSLDDFFSKVTSNTWLFIQLTDSYSESKDNYLYKLVAVGLCE